MKKIMCGIKRFDELPLKHGWININKWRLKLLNNEMEREEIIEHLDEVSKNIYRKRRYK